MRKAAYVRMNMVSRITRNYLVYFKLIYFKIISELPRNYINIFHSILQQKQKIWVLIELQSCLQTPLGVYLLGS